MARLPPKKIPPTGVVIPAAGTGTRMGGGENKVLRPLAGEPLVVHALRRFQEHPAVERMVLVVGEGEKAIMETVLAAQGDWPKLLPLVVGGTRRQESVANGLAALAANPPDWVLVHDGARPLCSNALVGRVLETLLAHDAVVPALGIHDTLRRMGTDTGLEGPSTGVVERAGVVRCQTPQGFHWEVLWGAHQWAAGAGVEGTDDAQLVEAAGGAVYLVPGEARNLKITTPEELALAEWWATRSP